MAARRKEVEPPDLGEPGMFYFPEPIVIDIKSKKPVIVETRQMSSYEAANKPNACRLKSSHEIQGYTPPTHVDYLLSKWPARMDIEAYIEMHKVEGFNEGTIVTRRFQPWQDMGKIHRWGVVLMVNKHMHSSEYKPYLVKWFGDNMVESAHAEDLYVIHAALDKQILADILEAQGETDAWQLAAPAASPV